MRTSMPKPDARSSPPSRGAPRARARASAAGCRRRSSRDPRARGARWCARPRTSRSRRRCGAEETPRGECIRPSGSAEPRPRRRGLRPRPPATDPGLRSCPKIGSPATVASVRALRALPYATSAGEHSCRAQPPSMPEPLRQLRGELSRRVVPGSLQELVARRDLEQDAHVAAGVDGDVEGGDRDSQDVAGGLVDAETIELAAVLEGAQRDDEVEGGLVLHRRRAERDRAR